ncbi:MAG: hypothetical protein KBA87_00615 [Lachnospiraceae bacterium]|nr:hypothetical protein [Lachnospiraceae bacterium]
MNIRYLMHRLIYKQHKGSYTVEAAGVMSMILVIIGMALTLSFQVYSEAATEIEKNVSDIDTLNRFRLSKTGQEIIEDVSERGNE